MNKVYAFVDSDLLNKSTKIAELGSGTFGNVAEYETPLGRYVVKETKKVEGLGYPSDFVTEVDSLFKFRSISSVVRLEGVCFDSKQRRGFILLEPMETSLKRWYGKAPFTERMKALAPLISMIGGALAIIHGMGFVHNDIKDNNILANSDFTFKLADFGKTSYVTDPTADYGGISRYCPFKQKDIFFSELYAFCVVLTECITGHKMISYGDGEKEEEREIRKFYNEYGHEEFDVWDFLRDKLSKEEMKQIPQIYWDYVTPVFEKEKITAFQAYRNVGFQVSSHTIGTVRHAISVQNKIHPEVEPIRKRCKKIIKELCPKKAKRILEFFERLMSKFLYTKEGSKLNDRTIDFYSEVALVILLGKHYTKSMFFTDEIQLLHFQRSFMAAVDYQTIVVEGVP